MDSFRHAGGLSSLDFSGSLIWDGLLMSVAEAKIVLKRLVLLRALGFLINGIWKIVLKHWGIEDLDLQALHFLTDRDMGMICKDFHSLTSIDVSHCSNFMMMTLYNFVRQCPS